MRRLVHFYSLLAALALVCSGTSFAVVNDAATKTSWGYKGHIGPEFWGRLTPQFRLCGEGKNQSPVNIAQNHSLVANTLSLHYQLAPLILMDDGMTDLTIGSAKTIINDGHTVQVNFHQGKRQREFIKYDAVTYDLVQFHFHSPSENQLNGVATPLEIHFVHQGEHGKVVVVGVLVKGGKASPVLQTIIDHLPPADGKEHVVPGAMINPGDLFPLDNDYYSFVGSLTTPPCTEGLQWIVMAGTVTASPGQIAAIRDALGSSNIRAVQPLYQRKIAYSMGSPS